MIVNKKDVRMFYRRFSESLLGLNETKKETPIENNGITDEEVEQFLITLEDDPVEKIEEVIPPKFD